MTGFGELNMEIPLILVISIFMSSSKFMLIFVEHEKSIITSEPGHLCANQSYSPTEKQNHHYIYTSL